MLNKLVERVLSVSDGVFEEIEGAEAYTKEAICLKEENRSIADTYISMASQELQHAEDLSEIARKYMAQLKTENPSCYEMLSHVWGFMEKKHRNKSLSVKAMIDVYKR